jgi:hypothetical protein
MLMVGCLADAGADASIEFQNNMDRAVIVTWCFSECPVTVAEAERYSYAARIGPSASKGFPVASRTDVVVGVFDARSDDLLGCRVVEDIPHAVVTTVTSDALDDCDIHALLRSR